jgi:dTDP-4-amino-4,6-dideoxygalactose transaminase
LIEDAAHSIGSTYKGLPIGSIADLTTFSFFPTKNITTAEGGAVSSNNVELLLKVKKFSRQGLVRNKEEFKIKDEGPWHQEVHHFGLNYRLPDVLCALGISQLAKLEEFKLKRKDIFNTYLKSFQEFSDIATPTRKSYVDVNWHLYPIRVDRSIRRQVFEELRRKGVGVQVNYMPAHWHPVFQNLGYSRSDFPVSGDFFSSEISLPMSSSLSIYQAEQIAQIAIESIQTIS